MLLFLSIKVLAQQYPKKLQTLVINVGWLGKNYKELISLHEFGCMSKFNYIQLRTWFDF